MHWRKSVPFPLWEHMPPGAATENRTQGPSPLSLHPNAAGKMAELHQGLATLQSGQITTHSPSLRQHYFGRSKQKQGEPPNTRTGGNRNHAERGGAWTCSSHSALELAHCFLTKRAVWPSVVPEGFLSHSSADFTELIVNTQSGLSRLSALS